MAGDEREMGVISGQLAMLISMVSNLETKLENNYVRKDLHDALCQRVSDLEDAPDKNQHRIANWLSILAFIVSAINGLTLLFKK
jgi:hypothetical protein